jgi:3-deoxy-D-manno-octulosonate 8-phosphate phosphatase (KDO 8-P phosphatase)
MTVMQTASDLSKIRILISDVDGVFTDGRLWQNSHGEWRRVFSVRDSLGVRALRRCGISVVILSDYSHSHAEEIAAHMRAIGVDDVIDVDKLSTDAGSSSLSQKRAAIERVLEKNGLTLAEAALLTFDWQDSADRDWAQGAGARFAVANDTVVWAVEPDFVTTQAGGDAVVMEVCAHLIRERKKAEISDTVSAVSTQATRSARI